VSTSVSATPPPDSTDSDPASGDPFARRDRVVRRVVTGVAALIVILVVFLVVWVQGNVSGLEFSPTHFQQRSFRFFEIPILHLQITPIRRAAQTPSTANYLRLNSLIQTPSTPPDAWHIVSIRRGITGTTPGDASLLTEQLELEDGADAYWRTWSIDHPKRAKVLWPVIQQLAVRELYMLMPPLFELAQREQTAAELQSAIESRLEQDYASLVQDLRRAGRDELADQILAEAREDFPESQQLQELRLSTPEPSQ
jgi:hypothetical protein